MSTRIGTHLANCRREATSATIGNCMVKFAVASLNNDICDFLLSNRSTNLYGGTCLCVDLAAHLAGRKGRTMYAIATSTPTKHHNMFAWLNIVGMTTMGQNTQATAEDQGIINIAGMIKDSAITGGDAHLISIIAHTIDDAACDTAWREYAGRKFFGKCLKGAEAEYICTWDRSG